MALGGVGLLMMGKKWRIQREPLEPSQNRILERGDVKSSGWQCLIRSSGCMAVLNRWLGWILRVSIRWLVMSKLAKVEYY